MQCPAHPDRSGIRQGGERSLAQSREKNTLCQDLERTPPCMQLCVGHIRTRTHDYARHVAITLFAALNYLDGKLIHGSEKIQTHVEWLRFLSQVGCRHASDRGQLLHIQAREGESVAGAARAIPRAFRADIQLMTRPSGAYFRSPYRRPLRDGRLYQRDPAGRCVQDLPGRAERQPKTVLLECGRRADPGQCPAGATCTTRPSVSRLMPLVGNNARACDHPFASRSNSVSEGPRQLAAQRKAQRGPCRGQLYNRCSGRTGEDPDPSRSCQQIGPDEV